jgi:hypothetical protein
MIPEVRACTTLSVLSGATARSDRSQNAGALGLEHLDEVQRLRSERGVPLLDPADPKTKERYGL